MQRLAELPAGVASRVFRISEVAEHDAPQLLAVLHDAGVVPEARIQVVDRADTQLRLTVEGQTVVLSEGVAAASFATVEAMEDKVDPGTPLVVVFGPSYSTTKGLREVQSLTRRRPEVASIMVVEELNTQMLQQALRVARAGTRCRAS